MSHSLIFYTAVLAAVIVQRLAELRLSNRNTRRALGAGATEVGADHYPWMVALHATFLCSALAEPWLMDRPFLPPLAALCGGLLLGAGLLRTWVIRTLGDRWTTRIICKDHADPITNGPYRFLRHPNYAAVIVEIAVLPMIHTAWMTAILFSSLNLLLLRVRISSEEKALSERGEYQELLGDRSRLLPRIGSPS